VFELVARYKLDENGGSEVDDDIWCDDLDGDVEGASWATGVWESGLDFDGSNDYVEIDHDSAFNLTDAISIALWAKWDTNGTYALASTASSGFDGGYDFFVYDNVPNGINHLGFYFDNEDGDNVGCDSSEDDYPLYSLSYTKKS
jgi:hypothetical protein